MHCLVKTLLKTAFCFGEYLQLYLKEILKDVCDYNCRGDNQGTYTLKPEYRLANNETDAAKMESHEDKEKEAKATSQLPAQWVTIVQNLSSGLGFFATFVLFFGFFFWYMYELNFATCSSRLKLQASHYYPFSSIMLMSLLMLVLLLFYLFFGKYVVCVWFPL